MATRLEGVPRGDPPVFVICHSGMRSQGSARFLRQTEIMQVAKVQGGIDAWRTAYEPLARGDTSLEKPRLIESRLMHAGSWRLAEMGVTDWQM